MLSEFNTHVIPLCVRNTQELLLCKCLPVRSVSLQQLAWTLTDFVGLAPKELDSYSKGTLNFK